MNPLTFILIGGGALLLSKALRTNRTASALTVDIAGLTDLVITVWQTKFKAVVQFTNPTDNDLSIQELSLNFNYGSTRLGSVTLVGQNITVPAKHSIQVQLPVSLSNTSTVTAFIEALQSGSDITIQVTGYAKANGFITNINQSIKI